MKKSILYIAMAAAAAATLVSCNKSELNEGKPAVGPNTVALSVSASNPDTKVTIGGKVGETYPMSWDAMGEKLKVVELVDDSISTVVSSSSYTLDGGAAHFNFSLPEKSGAKYDYFFFSPASAYKNSYSLKYMDISTTLPSKQTPFASSVDTSAVLLYGASKGKTVQGGSLDVKFKSIVAYGKLRVKNLSSRMSAGETVQQLEITAVGKNFAGTFYYYNLKDSISVKDGSNTIALDLKNVTTTSDFDAWFACLPVELAAGDSLVIVAMTNKDYYYKSVALTKARSFVAGQVSEFAVDMSTAIGSPDYSGNYVALIQNSGINYWALSTGQYSKSRLNATALTYDGSGSYVTSDATIFWTLERIAGSEYNLKNGTKCLGWKTGYGDNNNNAMLLDTTSFPLIVANDGEYYHIALPDKSRRLQKSSAACFAFYTGDMKDDFILVPATFDSKPVINPIAAQNVTASADTIEVAYSINNPTGDAVTATPQDGSWITVLSTADNKIKLAIAENTGKERKDSIVVSYPGAASVGFSVTQQGAGGVKWVRVTSVDTLLTGGTFIIGYEATAKSGTIVPMQNSGTATTSAAGLLNSGALSGSTGPTTINMNSVSDTKAFEVTIVASASVAGAICIKCGANFVGNTNTKNNLKLFTSESNTTSFTPTVGTNDVFTLKIKANATYHTLQYNSGSPRFCVYGGAQKNVVIYKKY